MQKDCPSQRAYIATEDGYISTSNIEDEEDEDTDEEGGEVLGDEATWPIGASLYSGCSTHKYNNLRSYNAITCSRFSSSSATVEHMSLLMEVATIIW